VGAKLAAALNQLVCALAYRAGMLAKLIAGPAEDAQQVGRVRR